jgi:Domain of unknown function (DUF222)
VLLLNGDLTRIALLYNQVIKDHEKPGLCNVYSIEYVLQSYVMDDTNFQRDDDRAEDPGAREWPAGCGTGPAGEAPGPQLAQILRTAAGQDGTGLDALTDGQLLDVICGGRQMQAWATWVELTAMAAYASRHPAGKGDPGLFARGAADEIGFAIRMGWMGAADRMSLGRAFARRLPETFAGLRDGRLDLAHARIIEDYTSVLSDEDAAEADKILAAAAARLTTGSLRDRAARVVLRIDPEAAEKRRQAARRESSVRKFREESGNAGITGRELPAEEMLAAWQHLEQRALELRDMGVDGSLRELRVLAFMDLLQERDGADRLTDQEPDPQDSTAQDSTAQDRTAQDRTAQDRTAQGQAAGDADADEDDLFSEWPDSEPEDRDDHDGTEPDDDEPADDEPDDDGPDDDGPDDGGSGPGNGGARPRKPSGPSGASGTRLAAQVIITVPFEAWLGQTSASGEVGEFGLADPEQVRDLLAAAARDRDSRGCVTLLGPDGTAMAHGCGRGPFTVPSDSANQDNQDGPDPPGERRPADPATWTRQAEDMFRRLKVSIAPIARDHCDHRSAEPARLPSRKLRHLIQARNPRCTAPGCGRPAAKCEADHTLAWEDGGITCECNLSPLCKHHHIVKHLKGWRLAQAKPGVLTWRTPAGRTYTIQPAPVLGE